MADDPLPRLPPAEAVEYFRRKGYRIGFAWQDVWQEEHARAFTVAKAMSRDVLETIRAAVDDALANGKTLDQFRAELTPRLQKLGWWGRQKMRDPLTGELVSVQLGSPRRLRIIYETNLRMAQAAGRWEQIQRTKHMLPYLRYTAVMDERTRPEHAEWHGTILPVDHPWWDMHYPPCGWNCRCTVIQLDADTIADRGWEISDAPPPAGPPTPYQNPRTGEIVQVPAGFDPGFAYNPGKAWLGGLEPLPMPELPELEPGVTGGPRVPRGAPSPPSLLPPDVGEQAAIDAFLEGAAGDDLGARAPVARLTGTELAPMDAERRDLRAAAKAELNALRGEPIMSELGPVRVGVRGLEKGTSGAPQKLRAAPAVRSVIENGRVTIEGNRKPTATSRAKLFARLRAPIEIDGERKLMTVTLEHRDGGWWYYTHAIEDRARSGRPLGSRGVSVGEGQDASVRSLPGLGDRSTSDIAGAGEQIQRGRVQIDASGWPLPIGPNWFVDASGARVVPGGDRRRVLGLVGRAIAAPREIRLRWATGADGRPMLFRRYIATVDGLAIVVDIGRAGWRFFSERDAGFDLARLAVGTVVWRAPQ